MAKTEHRKDSRFPTLVDWDVNEVLYMFTEGNRGRGFAICRVKALSSVNGQIDYELLEVLFKTGDVHIEEFHTPRRWANAFSEELNFSVRKGIVEIFEFLNF
jgi:hypothetical protein